MFKHNIIQFETEIKEGGDRISSVKMWVDNVLHSVREYQSRYIAERILLCNYLSKEYQKELRKLNADDFNSLDKDGDRFFIDSSSDIGVAQIIEGMGYKLTRLQENMKYTTYIFYKDNQ